MALYKDAKNKVHDDDNGAALSLSSWPKNLIPITKAEADAILNPPKTLDELKIEKHNELNMAFEADMMAVKNGYPQDEIASWPKQEEEARAYQANILAATPLLDALALARGIAKTDLVTRIIAKSDLFANISGQLIGKRQALEDTLSALPLTATKSDIDLIVW